MKNISEHNSGAAGSTLGSKKKRLFFRIKEISILASGRTWGYNFFFPFVFCIFGFIPGMLSSPATSVGLEKNALRTAMRVVDCLLFSYLGSNVVFNEIEFFTYINLWLLSLLILLFVFFVLIYVTVINLTSHVGNSALVEVFVTLGSLVYYFL